MNEVGRGGPVAALALSIALLVAHHLYAEWAGEVFLVVLVLVPMIGMLALGGLFHPPLLWAIGPRGQELPVRDRVIGGLLAFAGLAGGLGSAVWFYRVFG